MAETVGKQWGVYDTQDNVWLGTDDGPRLFDAEDIAQVSAQMADVRLGQKPGRCRAKEWAPQPVRLRDYKPNRISALQALEDLEEGRAI